MTSEGSEEGHVGVILGLLIILERQHRLHEYAECTRPALKAEHLRIGVHLLFAHLVSLVLPLHITSQSPEPAHLPGLHNLESSR